MEIYIAVRAQKLSDAKNALAAANITVLNSLVDRIEPAIRNMAEGLHRLGVVYDIAGCGVYWLLVEGGDDLERFYRFSAVECAFSAAWYQQQAAKVRYLKGIAYCDATEQWAGLFSLADQKRNIEVQFLNADVSPALIGVRELVQVEAPNIASNETPNKVSKKVPKKKIAKPKASKGEASVLRESLSLDFDSVETTVSVLKPGKKKRPAFKKRDKINEEQLDIFKTG